VIPVALANRSRLARKVEGVARRPAREQLDRPAMMPVPRIERTRSLRLAAKAVDTVKKVGTLLQESAASSTLPSSAP
jgi:hypothetical protein